MTAIHARKKQDDKLRNNNFLFSTGTLAAGLAIALIAATLSPPRIALGQDEHGHEAAAGASTSDTYYSCGMHPNIVQDEPGECPICGMTLTPKKRPSAKKSSKAARKSGEKKILYWVAPMDPSFRADAPGKSPMGMDLVPVYEDDGSTDGLVEINPIVVQNMGVRIAVARRGALGRSVRTVGQVVPAENRLSVVNLRFSGWIDRIFVDETGIEVKAGEALFTIYSPDLVSAQDELLVAMRTTGPNSGLARSARRRLSLFGLGPRQIDRIVASGKSRTTLTIPAPQAGYVLQKNVVEGAYVKAGVDLYEIANLDTVWIETEVYEFDASRVKLGADAEVMLTFQPGHPIAGKVSYVYPTLNPHSRTLRVRIELENPGLELKPGSFATVAIDSLSEPDRLLVPTEAIIHSGTRDLIFVAQALGRYEARTVITGQSGDGYITEILSGIEEGERVVVSGQFLLDSESQIQEAFQKMLPARLHARSAEAKANTLESTGSDDEAGSHEGSGDPGYWTCGMHPQIMMDEPGTCPICGMTLVHKEK